MVRGGGARADAAAEYVATGAVGGCTVTTSAKRGPRQLLAQLSPDSALGAIWIGFGQRWHRWSRGSDSGKIFVAALLVGAISLVVKIAGMGRELVTAATFGTSSAVDAFVLAWELPAFMINVIGGSFNAALIPIYIETRERSGALAANRLLTGVLVISFGVLAAAIVILAVAGPALLPLIASGFDPDTLRLTRLLLFLLLPSVMLSGLATLLTGVLSAGERFALGSASALAVPVCSIVALWLGRETWGITALAAGIVAGFALQLGLLLWGTRRAGVALAGDWREEAPAVRRVIAQYVPMVAGMLLISSTTLIDQAMATTLGRGSAATFSYSGRVVAVLLSVGSMALGTAVLPYFSRMVAARDWEAIRRTLRIYSAIILAVTIPGTLALFFLSEPIIRLMFERGAFTPADTIAVGRVQAMLALQIPFYSLGILYVRLISSLQANRILMYGTGISFALNIVLDYLFKEWFGVAGIALATSLVYLASLIYLSTMLSRLLRKETRSCA